MPPIDYKNYPAQWKQIRARILERDGYKCGRCEARAYLACAHLDHDTTNNSDQNLLTLCRACHLSHDKYQHSVNAKATRQRQKQMQHWRLWDERNEDAFLSDF